MIFPLVLFLIRLIVEFDSYQLLSEINHFYFHSFIDLFLAASVYFLFREIQFFKSYRSYSAFKELGHTRFLFQFNFGVFVDFVRFISLFFAFSWWLRWFNPEFDFNQPQTYKLYYSYLDSYLFCWLLTAVFKPERAGRLLNKINLTNHRVILLQFLTAIIIGSILLQLPFMQNPGHKLSVVDAIFLSVSALSVTGLSPVDISIVLNFWGQLVLLILIQLGGLGVIVLTMGLTSAIRQKLSLKHIKLSQSSFDGCYVGNASDYLKKVVILTLIIESIGTLLIYLSLPAAETSRLFSAVFHSVSAFCNAGFSLYSQNIQAPVFNHFGISTLCLLIFLGGLGFPVFIELIQRFNSKTKEYKSLSPQTKFALLLSFTILIAGTFLFFFLINPNSQNEHLSTSQQFYQAIFYSISSRTAGFNLLMPDHFGLASQMVLILLMFIGANPSSTGGGVKTTTIGVLFSAIATFVQNKNQIIIFKRAVSNKILLRSISIVGIYAIVATGAVVILAKTENIDIFRLLFEVVSALSTVGLTLSVTHELTLFGKFVIIFLMIFGRIGLITLITAGTGEIEKSKIYYPEDDFFVG